VRPLDDPTLLFVNSGMCQFKPIFLGSIDPNTPFSKLKRACNTQKCIRAGGKHNDLDDVGKDTYHHTFFEMLGNWSFGDYFKKEAIQWAHELLVGVYGLDPDRMYATYFEGHTGSGLPADLEAKELWSQLLKPDHVIPGNMKDNFWEMGPVGPCGPCSEIHYDRIGGRNAADRVNKDDPDVIEIWNLVFMQFSREPDRSLKPLPDKHIDTGMGFERLVSILQDKRSNYDTDVFMPIFGAIEKVAKPARPYAGLVGAADADRVDMAYRVVADHIRNVSFAIADGIQPGNDERNYVIKRILRRAIRYGRQFLGAEVGFMKNLVPTLVDNMGHAFPELIAHQKKIEDVIYREEISFARTLDKGINIFRKFAQETKDSGSKILSGEKSWMLYDTYGFPIDLTKIMAEEAGLDVDQEGFNSEKDRASARDKNAGFVMNMVLEAEHVAHLQSVGISPTNDEPKYTWNEVSSGTVKALFHDRKFIETSDECKGATFGIILDKTSFYAESGGQVDDTGRLFNGDFVFEVSKCQTYGGYVVHFGTVSKGSIKVGHSVEVSVDYSRRSLIAPNHTTTHMLNFALFKVLGSGLDQMGSLVDAEKLRFDFSFNRALKIEELEKIQGLINEQISKELSVFVKLSPLEAALKICSLRAIFGEKYPDPVRVVCVGHPVEDMLADPKNDKWFNFSVEFCGGTHLSNTNQATLFSIISEESVASGVRRIIAFTGQAAQDSVDLGEEYISTLKALDEAESGDLASSIAALRRDLGLARAKIPVIQLKKIENMIDGLVKKSNKLAKDNSKANAGVAIEIALKTVGDAVASGKTFLVLDLDVGTDSSALKDAVTKVLETHEKVAVLLVSSSDDKVLAYAGVSPSLQSKEFDAVTWVRTCLGSIGGKGGGKPGMAQGQAKSSDSSTALTAGRDFAAKFFP